MKNIEKKDIVRKEYENDSKLIQGDVKKLLEWLEGQAHLPRMTDQEVIWFLKSCYYSNELAKLTIDTYFTMKTLTPDVLGKKSVKQKNIQAAMDVVSFSMLPNTPEGHRVILSHMEDVNASHFNFNDSIKIFDMVAMLDMYQNGTSNGFRCCFDMKDVSFTHAAKLGLVTMKKFLYYLQEGMPIRLKGLHFFNVTPVIDKVLMIAKPFLKKEVLEMLYVHNSMEEMFQYIPQECLPEDYGGKYHSYEISRELMKKNLMENEEFFEYQDSQLVDESKREGKPKSVSDIFGIEGTFKKLELD